MNTVISPGDSMFCREFGNDTAWQHYCESGRTALRGIRAALLLAEREPQSIRRILDLPCGHGRILRVLKAAFPEAKITGCDIDRAGVDFCASTLGAEPVYSVPEPEKIPVQGPFDLIWVGSLLTHLDADRWPRFLKRFREWLSPGGVCVFTTHGVGAVEYIETGQSTYGIANAKDLLRGYRKSGFDYRPYAKQDYGVSLSSVAWVAAQVAALQRTRLLLFAERGWHDHQDLVAFTADPAR